MYYLNKIQVKIIYLILFTNCFAYFLSSDVFALIFKLKLHLMLYLKVKISKVKLKHVLI